MLTAVGSVDGEAGGVRATLGPVSLLACPQGHERRFPYPSWGLDLSEAVTRAFPASRSGGLLRPGERCFGCLGLIDRTGVRRATTSATVELPAGPLPVPVTMVLEVDAERVTCARCGLDQALGRSGDVPWHALIAAFDAAGLPGSPGS